MDNIAFHHEFCYQTQSLTLLSSTILLQIRVCNAAIHLVAVWLGSWLMTLNQKLSEPPMKKQLIGKILFKTKAAKIKVGGHCCTLGK